MPLTLQSVRPLDMGNKIQVKPVFAGNYAPGGDPLNLQSVTDPNGFGVIVPTVQPSSVDIAEESIAGYYAETVRGTGPSNWKLQIFAAGGAELGAAPYPAGVLNGTIILEIALAPNNG